MHAAEQFSIGDWIEYTLKYQHEDVFMLYAIVFTASLLLCIATYKKACSTQHDMNGEE